MEKNLEVLHLKRKLIHTFYNGEVKCPRCNQAVFGYPALSRIDNRTYICNNCGTEEAIRQFFSSASIEKQQC